MMICFNSYHKAKLQTCVWSHGDNDIHSSQLDWHSQHSRMCLCHWHTHQYLNRKMERYWVRMQQSLILSYEPWQLVLLLVSMYPVRQTHLKSPTVFTHCVDNTSQVSIPRSHSLISAIESIMSCIAIVMSSVPYQYMSLHHQWSHCNTSSNNYQPHPCKRHWHGRYQSPGNTHQCLQEKCIGRCSYTAIPMTNLLTLATSVSYVISPRKRSCCLGTSMVLMILKMLFSTSSCKRPPS